MYDTVPCYLSQSESKSNFKDVAERYLIDVRKTAFENGNVSISGRLKGDLHFTASDTKIRLNKGSFNKYYQGDNIQTLTRGDMQRAVEKLSDELHLDFSEAIPTRVDLAGNILTKYPETNYYRYLGELPNHERHEKANSIYYENHQKTLLFYAKILEQTQKGNTVPDWLKGRHMIRYERRLTQRVSEQLKQPVRLKNLYHEHFYIQMIDEWHKAYKSIQKQNRLMAQMTPITGIKDLTEQAIYFWTQTLGINETNQLLDQFQSMGTLDRKAKSDIKKKIKSIRENFDGGEQNELITELDQKIEDRVKHYR